MEICINCVCFCCKSYKVIIFFINFVRLGTIIFSLFVLSGQVRLFSIYIH